MKARLRRLSRPFARLVRVVTRDMALRWRLTLMLMLLTAVSISALGVISVRIYTDNIIGQTIERKNELGASTLEAIDIIHIRDEYSVRQVERNDNVMGALSYSGPQTPYLHFLEVWNCSKVLFDLADKSNIVGLAAIGYNGKSFFSKSETATTNTAALMRLTDIDHVKWSSDRCVWIPSRRNIFSAVGSGDGSPMLYVVKKVYYARNMTRDAVGYSVAQVQYSRLYDILKRTSADSEGYATVADGSYTILCTTGDQSAVGTSLPPEIWSKVMQADHGSFRLRADGGSTLYLFNKAAGSGWVLIQAIPYAHIAGAADEVNRWTVAVAAACMAVSIVLSWLFAKTVANPVVRLEKVMSDFGGGKLTARSATDRSDEIGHLQQSFNSMAGQIGTLLEGMEEEHRQKRMLEIRMLEYQINPHFLYNSLDTINWMANSSGNREIAEMAAALARFFRIGLSRGREIVSVADEIEHARNYLVISNIRYHDGFSFHVSVDPAVRDCKVVKLITQPLAENTLVHAIKKTGAGGQVSIRAFPRESCVAIEVEDNGRGIPPEKLIKLRETLADRQRQEGEAGDGGIGLMNVQRRIQLYYGPEFGLEIDSEEGKGTVVRIVLPMVR